MSDNTEYVRIAAAVVLPNLGGFLGSFYTRKNIRTWYESLQKPWWRPPNWVFGPMWTYLYSTMGYASYLVWKDGGGFDGAMVPLGLYGTSLALNWIWSPIYFGYHKMGLASGVIVAYLGVTGLTAYSFWSINKTASYLLFPLMGWLSLASSICIYTWQNNKEKSE
ncbi:translocator protein-like [Amphiura filiformis]|uniref:translocator protein-like n=1 Tax=Amphiura filiformis TaxID=82378 RepID=UPI003B21D748